MRPSTFPPRSRRRPRHEHPGAIRDPKVFGQHFRADTWNAWLAFLCALFALPLSSDELELYRKHTDRTKPPTAPFREAWLVIGRRGGKSFVLACIAVFLACFRDWRRHFGPGELRFTPPHSARR